MLFKPPVTPTYKAPAKIFLTTQVNFSALILCKLVKHWRGCTAPLLLPANLAYVY